MYLSYNQYLKEKFGQRVFKVCIDGGFDCPNRDGTKAEGGCRFCDVTGSSSRTNPEGSAIQAQVLENIRIRQSRFKAKKFIAYFQSFSNTYAPLESLKLRYDAAISAHEDIVGLSIATRTDCVDEEKIKLIASYKEKLPYVSIEYGLQSIHDHTLDLLNCQHDFSDFENAFALAEKYQLEHCIHVILGLPGESREDMLQTARMLKKMNVRGVKIHMLVAMERTWLARQYKLGKWKPMEFDEFIDCVCDFVLELPPTCVIHRLGGNGHPLHTVAPAWVKERKTELIPTINKELERRLKALEQKQPCKLAV